MKQRSDLESRDKTTRLTCSFCISYIIFCTLDIKIILSGLTIAPSCGIMQRGIPLVINWVDSALPLVKKEGFDALFMTIGAGQV